MPIYSKDDDWMIESHIKTLSSDEEKVSLKESYS